MREAIASVIPPPPPIDGVCAERVVLAQQTGVAADTYIPSAPGPHPALIWFHGGGYVFGSAALDGTRMQAWSHELGCVVASVDYRLAPDHPFPAAHDDAVGSLDWLIRSAESLGVDTNRVVIGGASAGAGIAAGLGLAARDREIPLAGNCSSTPCSTTASRPRSSTWDAAMWSQASNEFGWRSYLGPLADPGADVPAYAAPATSPACHQPC